MTVTSNSALTSEQRFYQIRDQNLSSTKKNKSPSSKIRIIGGMWRGRKLSVANEIGLRPTGDRLRETLFNWIAADIPGAKCLDAFAGTGALGLEALSRGAFSTDFIEVQPRTAKTLNNNLSLLGAENSLVHCTDFAQWFPKTNTSYDIVFIDPPFDQNLWQASMDHLLDTKSLDKGSLIYVEAPTSANVSGPSTWKIIKQKCVGQIEATVYETTNPNQARIP